MSDCLPFDVRPTGKKDRRRWFRRVAAVAALVVLAAAGSAGCAARSRTAVANAQTAVRVKTALVNDVELGTLPIDVEAEDSPSGDGRWDGVALTLFADPDLIGRDPDAVAVP